MLNVHVLGVTHAVFKGPNLPGTLVDANDVHTIQKALTGL